MPVPKRAPKPEPLFDYRVDVANKIQACQESGIELAEWEQELLRDWRSYRKPTQAQYRLLWRICARCGVK
jgi:hypothetical protein